MAAGPVAASATAPPSAAALLALLAGLVVVAALYAPALHGPFLFDDFPNLVRNQAITAWRTGQGPFLPVLMSAHAGPLGRPLAVLTLAWQAGLQGAAAGLQPWPFKVFNLLVHLASTVLVWALARVLLAAPKDRTAADHPWPLVAAFAWALHPLALNPVLYVVQRMSSLSALGLLLALNLAVRAHARAVQGQAIGAAGWLGVPAAVLLALLAKENAVLFAPCLLVLEGTLLANARAQRAAPRSWRWFCGVYGGVGTGLLLAVVASHWGTLVAGHAARGMTLPQHLLTEARIFWLYLRLTVLPDPGLLALNHDDLVLSTGWITPVTTLPAVLALAALVAAAVAVRRRLPWFAFAVGFVLACLLLESTVVPLELMHEHRMYLALVAPCLALTAALRALPGRALRTTITGLVLLALGTTTAVRAAGWANPLVMAELEAQHHPASLHAQFDLAVTYGSLAERTTAPVERTRLFTLATQAAQRAAEVAPAQDKGWYALVLLAAVQQHPPQEGHLARFQQALNTGPRPDLMVDDLRQLLACRDGGTCAMADGDLATCVRALLLNPALAPPDRNRLLEGAAPLRVRLDARLDAVGH